MSNFHAGLNNDWDNRLQKTEMQTWNTKTQKIHKIVLEWCYLSYLYVLEL